MERKTNQDIEISCRRCKVRVKSCIKAPSSTSRWTTVRCKRRSQLLGQTDDRTLKPAVLRQTARRRRRRIRRREEKLGSSAGGWAGTKISRIGFGSASHRMAAQGTRGGREVNLHSCLGLIFFFFGWHKSCDLWMPGCALLVYTALEASEDRGRGRRRRTRTRKKVGGGWERMSDGRTGLWAFEEPATEFKMTVEDQQRPVTSGQASQASQASQTSQTSQSDPTRGPRPSPGPAHSDSDHEMDTGTQALALAQAPAQAQARAAGKGAGSHQRNVGGSVISPTPTPTLPLGWALQALTESRKVARNGQSS